MTELSTIQGGQSCAASSAANFSAAPLADSSATAQTVADLFQAGRSGEATAMLNTAREGQPQAVQDALDRMVGARLDQSLNPSQPLGTQQFFASPAEIGCTIRRVNDAGLNAPALPDTTGLSDAQKYDVYSSIVEVRGNQASQDALANGDRVILGLRNENVTTTNNGQGVYDDRMVVLARDADGTVHVNEFNRASTEPTAQYDANQRSNPAVTFRREDSVDITGDGVGELGRIAEGTIEMFETTHRNPASAGTNFSLRPTAAAVAASADGVQRDSNHDGLFTAADPGGSVALNDTFKIHSGSRTNTDSAGCTTLHPNDYAAFRDAVTADANQNRWQYVLTHTAP